MIVPQAGNNICTQDKGRNFAENQTSRRKPTGESDFSILEVRHENNLGLLDRTVYHPVFLCVRHCLRLRCDPGYFACIGPQPEAGSHESIRAKPGYGSRRFSKPFLLFLKSVPVPWRVLGRRGDLEPLLWNFLRYSRLLYLLLA